MKIHLKNYILYRIVQLASFSLRTAVEDRLIYLVEFLFVFSFRPGNKYNNKPSHKKKGKLFLHILAVSMFCPIRCLLLLWIRHQTNRNFSAGFFAVVVFPFLFRVALF